MSQGLLSEIFLLLKSYFPLPLKFYIPIPLTFDAGTGTVRNFVLGVNERPSKQEVSCGLLIWSIWKKYWLYLLRLLASMTLPGEGIQKMKVLNWAVIIGGCNSSSTCLRIVISSVSISHTYHCLDLIVTNLILIYLLSGLLFLNDYSTEHFKGNLKMRARKMCVHIIYKLNVNGVVGESRGRVKKLNYSVLCWIWTCHFLKTIKKNNYCLHAPGLQFTDNISNVHCIYWTVQCKGI